jgi:hypothetical protein
LKALHSLLIEATPSSVEPTLREVSLYSAAARSGMKKESLLVLLTHLEVTHRLLRLVAPRYSAWQFRPLDSHFSLEEEAARGPAFAALQRASDFKRLWFHVDLSRCAEDSFRSALEMLEREGKVAVTKQEMRRRFHLLLPVSLGDLVLLPSKRSPQKEEEEEEEGSEVAPIRLEDVAEKEFLRMCAMRDGAVARLNALADILRTPVDSGRCAAAQLRAHFEEAPGGERWRGERERGAWRCGKCFVCCAAEEACDSEDVDTSHESIGGDGSSLAQDEEEDSRSSVASESPLSPLPPSPPVPPVTNTPPSPQPLFMGSLASRTSWSPATPQPPRDYSAGCQGSINIRGSGDRPVYIGPRGGVYYVNSSGNKSYVNSANMSRVKFK